MREYSPLFNLSNMMIKLLTEISEELGRVGILFSGKMNDKLYKENLSRRIYSSLAIEDSKISLEEVRCIILGESSDYSDLRIVKNLYNLYNMSFRLNTYSVNDLLFSHKMLMDGFNIESTEFREDKVLSTDNRIFKNDSIPSRFVPGAIRDIFDWYNMSELHPLIKSTIVYFELEILEPFRDGSGIISRLWFDLMLCKWKDVFSYIAVEEELYKRISEYKALIYSMMWDCNSFIEFTLEIILDTLKKANIKEKSLDNRQGQVIESKYSESHVEKEYNVNENLFAKRLVDVLGDEILSTNEIMLRLGMNHKPTFRKNYLNPAIEMGMVEMTVPGKPRSKNQRYRKIS